MSKPEQDLYDCLDDYELDALSDTLLDDYDERLMSLSSSCDVPTFDIGFNNGLDEPLGKTSRDETYRINDDELRIMAIEYHEKTYLRCSMYDKTVFYMLQAELLVNSRQYKDALNAALVAEELSGPSKVIDAIKMICMYQLNEETRFKALKEQFNASGFSGLSESLKKQALGTVQVSNFIPEFLDCIDKMKRKQ